MNLRRLLSLALLLFEASLGLTQSGYPAKDIPAILKKDADMVVRRTFYTLNVEDESLATLKVHEVRTILNSRGKEHRRLVVSYDDEFHKTGKIEGNLYDAEGKLLRQLKKKEIKDVSTTQSGVGDSRAKVAELTHTQYPYTVEYIYDLTLKGIFYFPSWVPQRGENMALEQGKLTVLYPDDQLRYKSLNGPGEPDITQGEGQYRYTWTLSQLPPVQWEPFSPSTVYPRVLLAPNAFEIAGYRGNAKDWQSFGKFIYELNQDRDQLPEALKQEVARLTADKTTPLEKIEALFRYMQENTRYVSVQLGIGGWQSFRPEYVYENGYGDCKALSNYMKAMLNEVGIPSYQALVYAGTNKPDIYADFPGNQFNHVILAVPQATDTLWLECTSSLNPVGYLGDFTENRHVLLLTPEGGKLVRTPSRRPVENRQIRQAEVFLEANGNARVLVSTLSTGYQQEALRQVAKVATQSEQEDWLKDRIDLGNFEINSFSFEEVDTLSVPAYRLNYELAVNKWASVSGPRLFMGLHQIEQSHFVPPDIDHRMQDVEVSYPYWDRDSVTFHLPANMRLEALPETPISLENPFATYEAHLQPMEDGTLIYTRDIKFYHKRLGPETYQGFREFFQKVTKADQLLVVLSGKS